jgi:hypothetical protein
MILYKDATHLYFYTRWCCKIETIYNKLIGGDKDMTLETDKKTKPTTVALPLAVRGKVDEDAAKKKRSASFICAEIIEKHYARRKPQSA